MIKNIGDVNLIKQSIERLKGSSVKVTVNLGRNKFASFDGKISGVYPALFTVVPLSEGITVKTAYSYSEYMCGKVKVKKAD